MKKKFIIIPIVVIVVVILLFGITIIPTGYTGVLSTFGQISSKSLSNGINYKFPFVQNIELVNNKQQDIVFDDEIWSETRERTAIYYTDVTVTYQINPEKSAWIFANVANYEKSLVTQSLVSSGIKTASKVLSDTDATNRSIIEPEAMAQVQKLLDEKYGPEVVIINKVVIGNAQFDESYNDAIAAKQRATLEAQQQAIENQRAIDKAEADATVVKTQAQAKADAMRIEAEAEAEANRLLEESLTDNVLKYQYLEKWDGKLPTYVGGDSGSVLIGIDGSVIGSAE